MINRDIPTHLPFSVSCGPLLHFKMWGCHHFFCMFFPLVYRSVYWHFVCTITRWECKGGKSCSSIIIFMWSKQWEGALLWCTNLVIVSWLTETGFYMILQEEEDWRVFQGSVQSNYIKIYFLTYILWLTTMQTDLD